MGLEYIQQPQVFLSPISAQQGIRGLIENYPLLTTFQSWTSTISVPTSTLNIPGFTTMLETPAMTGEVVPESFIVTVGGVVQAPSNYRIFNYPVRRIIFDAVVPKDTTINLTQLATHSPSSQRFNYLRADSALITNLTSVTIVFLTSFTVTENLSAFTVTDIIAQNTLSATVLNAGSINARTILSADANLYNLFLPVYGGSINSNTNGPALTITQTGTGDVLRVQDQAGDTSPFVIDHTGKVGVGLSTPTQALTLETTNTNGMSIARVSDDTVPGSLLLGKTRGTPSNKTNLLQNDVAGQILFQGWDTGGSYNNAAAIEAVVATGLGLSSVPADLVFKTNASPSTNPTEQVRITNIGNVGIATTTPNERLTVVGNISSTSIVYASGGDSRNWNTSFNRTTFLTTASSNFLVQGGNTFTADLSVGTNDARDVIFETNSSERMRISSSGAVGIGITNPSSATLVISRSLGTTPTSNVDGAIIFNTINPDYVGDNRVLDFGATPNGGGFIRAVGGTGKAGNLVLYSNALSAISNAFIEGNTYIGNGAVADAAGRYLDITNTGSSNNASSILRLVTQQVASTNPTTVDFVKYKNGIFAINNNETNASAITTFGVGGVERMRIDSSGNVGIGVTNPTRTLDLLADVSSIGINIRGRSSDNTGAIVFNNSTGNSGTQINYIQGVPNSHLAFATNNTERMRIDSFGVTTFSRVASGTAVSGNFTGGVPLIRVNGTTAQYSEPAIDFGEQSLTATARIASKNALNGGGDLFLMTRSPSASNTQLFPRICIKGDGMVGIGTTAPAARLAVVSPDDSATTTIASFDSNNITSAIQIGHNRITQVNSSPSLAFLRLGVSNNLDAVCIGGSGNVGIGTTNPVERLTVDGNIFLGSAGPTITFNSGGPSISVPAANTLVFSTAGTERMRFNNLGNVGIGTTNPLTRLHVVGPSQTDTLLVANSLGGCYIYAYSTGNLWGGIGAYSNSGSDRPFILQPGGGNVGIGTINPTERLHIEGTLSTGNIRALIVNTAVDGYSTLSLRNDRASVWRNGTSQTAYGGANSLNIGTIDGDNVSVVTNNNTRMLINSVGNVGIGTTNPGNILSVVTNAQGTQGITVLRPGTGDINLRPHSNSGDNNGIVQSGDQAIIFSGSAINTGNLCIAPWANTTSGIRITSAGNVGIGITLPQFTLDVAGVIRAQANAGSGDCLIIGNDTKLVDINIANICGLYGFTNEDRAGLRLGSSGPTLYGSQTGFLGIGTTSPTTRLTIESAGVSYPNPTNNDLATIRVTNTTSNNTAAHALLSLNTTGANGGNPFISFDVNGITGWSVGLDNADSDKFKIANSWSELSSLTRLTITTGGNVGIGTTNPQQTLHVQGNVRVGDATFTQPSGSAPLFGCRAWVNFDCTRNAAGGTDSANTARFIRQSGNVTSVVKNKSGDYTITFTTAMPDADYCVSGSTRIDTGAVDDGNSWIVGVRRAANNPATTTCRIGIFNHNNNSNQDPQMVSVMIIR